MGADKWERAEWEKINGTRLNGSRQNRSKGTGVGEQPVILTGYTHGTYSQVILYSWDILIGHTHGSYTWVIHTGHTHRSYSWVIHYQRLGSYTQVMGMGHDEI